MASLFAVGLPFTYNGTTNHFATSTGGTASVAAVTSADTVTVDSLSGNATLTIGATWSCSALTISNGSATVACDGTHGITASGAVTLTAGTLNTNGQTCSWGSFSSSNANARTLTLGASNITITGTGTPWTISTPTNLIFNSNTSTITCSGAGVTFAAGSPAQTYHDVVLSGSGVATLNSLGTFNNFTRTGTALKTDSFVLNGSNAFTVNGTLTLTGNSTVNRLLVQNTTLGTAKTVSAAAISLTNVDFQDITGAGLPANASWTGTSLGDCLGNSNITFDTPVAQTWSGNTTGNWSTAANWTSRVPLPQDNVTINGLTAGTITGDMIRIGTNIDFSASSGGTISVPSPFTWNVYGNFNAGAVGIINGNNTINLSGRGSFTLGGVFAKSGNGASLRPTTGCTYTLNATTSTGSSTSAGNINVQAGGTLATNGFALSTASVQGGAGALDITNSQVTCTGTGTVWTAHTTLTTTGSTIVLSDASATAKTFAGGGRTYNNVNITGGGAGSVTFTGANTFANLPQIVGGTKSIVWPGSATTTFTNGGNFGNSANLITMTASAGSATLSFGTQVNADHLSLTNIPASTTTPAYAGDNSTDGGGNTNWVFTVAPSVILKNILNISQAVNRASNF